MRSGEPRPTPADPFPSADARRVPSGARYGFRQEANRIAMGLLEAAAHSNYRLPEAFSGYDRSFGRKPVPYPTACDPHAWASAAPLLILRTLLGLNPQGDRLAADPHLPGHLGQIRLHDVQAGGRRWNVTALQARSTVVPAD